MATRFCTACGQPIESNTKFCIHCGAPIQAPIQEPTQEPIQEPIQEYYKEPAPTPPSTPRPEIYQEPQQNYQPTSNQPERKPNNYLAKAIVFTALFCFPFGIPAIINAAKVDGLWKQGLYAEAQAASEKANHWCRVTLILGIVFWAIFWTIYIIFYASLIADLF